LGEFPLKYFPPDAFMFSAGFLGSRIIESLLQRKEKVIVFDFASNNSWSTDSRITYIKGDVTKYEEVKQACQGINTVFFTAAIINFMDNLPYQYEASYRVNVIGTENVVKACQEQKVRYLVQTSTLHVTIQNPYRNTNSLWSLFSVPKKSVILIKEDDAYVTRDNATSHYGSTKALAEQIVLQANSSTLSTISIRPPGIFGSHDHLVAEDMLHNSEYLFIGFSMLIDWEYVDNICFSHLLAEAKLRTSNQSVSGHAFLISNNEAILNDCFRTMFVYYGNLKATVGPPRLIWMLGYLIEILQRILGKRFPRLGHPLNCLTLTALRIMDLDLSVTSTKAKDLLGYFDVFTVEEGIQLSVIEYRQKGVTLFSVE
jgi:nucleoside-diphosphate-sugar epimerase